MTDRLAEIKERQAKKAPWSSQERQVDRADIDWLIQEVERLRAAKEPWRIGEYSNVG